MYNNLKKIVINTYIYNQKFEICFDNLKQKIIVNKKNSSKDYYKYLDKLLNIIRFWPINEKYDNPITTIKIEEDIPYYYYVSNNTNTNYNSFIDLIFEII